MTKCAKRVKTMKFFKFPFKQPLLQLLIDISNGFEIGTNILTCLDFQQEQRPIRGRLTNARLTTYQYQYQWQYNCLRWTCNDYRVHILVMWKYELLVSFQRFITMPRWGLVRTQFLLQSIHFNGNNKRQFRSNINDWPLPPIQNSRLIYRSRDTAHNKPRASFIALTNG